MIGSFWNLCRATCPAMPVDKQLHSEYRSTYRWHEYTGPRQEVVRKPPIQNGNVVAAGGGGGGGGHENFEKSTREDDFQTDSGPKQEPAMPRRKKYPDLAYRHHEFLISDSSGGNQSLSSIGGGGGAGAGIDSRARSEERFGPNWRPSRRSRSEGPRRRGIEVETDNDQEPATRRESDSEMENMGRENGLLRKALSKINTEYRRQFAWPSGHATLKTDEVDGAGAHPRKSQSMGALKANATAMVHKKRTDIENKNASELEPLVDVRYNNSHQDKTQDFNKMDNDASWYREVVELRKKAGEYKHRGWESDLAPERLSSDIYNKQIELWDQVSRRSSLSALALASHMNKTYNTKEDKEVDNNRKSSPSKALRSAENNARMIRDIIHHHLEKTTGGSEFDGLIWSPTREKLEPTIPRKDDDSRGSQKNSPKKSSPLKTNTSSKRTGSSQKGKQARSQSVGPTESSNKDKLSPKRQSRSAVKEISKKTTASSNIPSNKRPRPSSEHERMMNIKSSDIPVEIKKSEEIINDQHYQHHHHHQLDSIEYEPIIKSPPEPTRVKSPEQIIMRSPDPVNWTVPLDTGKTFTVTQNVRDGDPASVNRPQSEVKIWIPGDLPPPVAQSAPPTLNVEVDAKLS